MYKWWGKEFDGDLIIPNLYLGSYCMNKELLEQNKITHVLTVSDEFPPAHPDKFEYMVVHISDDPRSNLIEAFQETTRFIDDGRKVGSVFVHCAAGISRSPTVVVAYLLLAKLASSPEEAIEIIKKGRNFVCPNTGFWKQIQTLHSSGYDMSHSSVTNILRTILPKPSITYHGKSHPQAKQEDPLQDDDE